MADWASYDNGKGKKLADPANQLTCCEGDRGVTPSRQMAR